MIDIGISKELKEICPDLVLGCIQGNIVINKTNEKLWKDIDLTCNEIRESLKIEDIASLCEIKEARQAYRKLGKDPTRYRISSEALFRRILKGKGLYKINNIVDINNLVSLKSACSVGTYDIENIKPPIVFTIGKKETVYKGIGRELINIENLPIFDDSIGSFGSPTSDAERAMITSKTKKILMNIISFRGKKQIEKYLNDARRFLKKYAECKNIEIETIE